MVEEEPMVAFKNRMRARAVNVKITTGCSKCNATKHLQRHHFNYNKPRDVVILCRKCHMEVHKKTNKCVKVDRIWKINQSAKVNKTWKHYKYHYFLSFEPDTIKRVEALAKKHDRKRADMLRVLVLKGMAAFERVI